MTIGALPQVVADAHGSRFALTSELGGGGQGVVYGVEGGRYAVKVLRARSDTDRSRLARKLNAVRRQPLQDLRVARPLELLAPPLVGYVMELIEGSEPMSTLMAAPRGAELATWYAETGGIARRYQVAYSMMETLARLHRLGLMYVDPSPANVLVDRLDVGAMPEAWLIDADNVRAESVAGDTVYTRFWAAPELVSGSRPASSLTDAWAAAVIAFKVITLAHPLIGDVVTEGPPELEDDALAGRFPWIDDPKDDSNRSSAGLPRELIFTKRLRELLHQMFGDGMHRAAARPGTHELSRELGRAWRMLTVCDSCAQSFLFTPSRACAFCGQVQGPRVLMRVVFRENSGPSAGWGQHLLDDRIVLDSSQPFTVHADLVGMNTLDHHGTPVAEISFARNVVTVRLVVDVEIEVEGSGNSVARRRGDELRVSIAPGSQSVVRFGSLSAPHRALVVGGV